MSKLDWDKAKQVHPEPEPTKKRWYKRGKKRLQLNADTAAQVEAFLYAVPAKPKVN
jgi:hypothetical protein